jgi:hypothetical protein
LWPGEGDQVVGLVVRHREPLALTPRTRSHIGKTR